MLEAREVHRKHLGQLFKLKVSEAQDDLVAPNVYTLAQQAYEPPGTFVWGLWDSDTPVGLLAMVDMRGFEDIEEGDDPDSAYLWRLMIAHEQQGKGYGRAAMEIAETKAREWGVPKLYLSYVDKPGTAKGFYDKLGYSHTGRFEDGEHEMVKPL